MTTWVQEVGQRFLSTRLSADKFLCTTGRQSHTEVGKKSTLINSTSTVCSIFLLRYLLWSEPPPRSIELSNEQNHHLREDDANFLSRTWVHTWASAQPHCFWARHIALHCERIFTWVQDTYRGKVIIPTKFANSCEQSSIKSWKWTVIISFPQTSFPSNNAHLTSIENNAFA